MDIHKQVIKILFQWSGWWYGWDKLVELLEEDGIEISVKEIKQIMKELRLQNRVRCEAIFDESTLKLMGRGYFINHRINQNDKT